MKKTIILLILILLSLITLSNVYATDNDTQIDNSTDQVVFIDPVQNDNSYDFFTEIYNQQKDSYYNNSSNHTYQDLRLNDSFNLTFEDWISKYNESHNIFENQSFLKKLLETYPQIYSNPSTVSSDKPYYMTLEYFEQLANNRFNSEDTIVYIDEDMQKRLEEMEGIYDNVTPADFPLEIILEDARRESLKYCGGDLSIIQKDLVKIYGDETKFKATLYDTDDLRMKNKGVFFKVNGVTYSRRTNDYGQAFLNINLPPGNYTIKTINFAFNTEKTSKITILPNMDENKDIVKYYKNDTQYTIRLLDTSGNPAPNKKVTFNINGVFYERISNSTGYAKLNINLHPGTYIITAEYENCKISNNITVLPVLSANDISMQYLDNTQFTVNLIDGQGKSLAGENVTLNINGVFYQRTTDNQGIARLNIRLMPGKYIITSTFNGTSISNTINIAETKRE